MNKNTLLVSLFLSLFLLVGMNLYYPGNTFSEIVSEAGLDVLSVGPDSVVSSTVSFSMQYLIMVFAIYLFLRTVTKAFDRRD